MTITTAADAASRAGLCTGDDYVGHEIIGWIGYPADSTRWSTEPHHAISVCAYSACQASAHDLVRESTGHTGTLVLYPRPDVPTGPHTCDAKVIANTYYSGDEVVHEYAICDAPATRMIDPDLLADGAPHHLLCPRHASKHDGEIVPIPAT